MSITNWSPLLSPLVLFAPRCISVFGPPCGLKSTSMRMREKIGLVPYHWVYTGADAHVRPHGGAEVVVASPLETPLQYERSFAVGHRELVDEVLNVDGDFEDTFSVFKTRDALLPWHLAPYFWDMGAFNVSYSYYFKRSRSIEFSMYKRTSLQKLGRCGSRVSFVPQIVVNKFSLHILSVCTCVFHLCVPVCFICVFHLCV